MTCDCERCLLRQIQAEQVSQRERLTTILSTITKETQRDIQQEKRMAKKLAEIVADAKKNAEDQQALITQQTTVLDGVKVFIQGQAAQVAALKTQIQELIDAGGDPVQLSQLEGIVAAMQVQEDALKANTDAIAEAVNANTQGSPA